MSVLVVTAVAAERDAVLTGDPGATVLVGGVGPVAAAVTTARALALEAYTLVVNAGVAGGFPGRAAVGDVVVGTGSVFADLGALTDDGFLDLAALGPAIAMDGLAGGRYAAPPPGRGAPVAPGAVRGDILTLATMTGTDARGAELAAAYPDAVAEAMEGYGVAAAAVAAGVPWVEVRTVSNLVGRRDRSAWDLPGAFRALSEVFRARR